jgi:hypothetical protein
VSAAIWKVTKTTGRGHDPLVHGDGSRGLSASM